MTAERPFANLIGMGSTDPLRTGQIVRYTDPNGIRYDAVIEEITDDEVFIRYKPLFWIRYDWVDIKTVEVPE